MPRALRCLKTFKYNMALKRVCDPYTILGLWYDMVYGSNFMVHSALQARTCWELLRIGGPLCGCHIRRALIFEVYIGATDFFKVPYK